MSTASTFSTSNSQKLLDCGLPTRIRISRTQQNPEKRKKDQNADFGNGLLKIRLHMSSKLAELVLAELVPAELVLPELVHAELALHQFEFHELFPAELVLPVELVPAELGLHELDLLLALQFFFGMGNCFLWPVSSQIEHLCTCLVLDT
ncbi:hypothetical protein LXL04_034394 [Taraxacum kok-saghyz]